MKQWQAGHTAGARGQLFAASRLFLRRKRGFRQIAERPCQSPPEIVFGVGMASREMRTGEFENGLDQSRWKIAPQQLFSDPEIHDAPIGCGKPLQNPQTLQPGAVHLNGLVSPKCLSAEDISTSPGRCPLASADDNRRRLRRMGPDLLQSRRRGGEQQPRMSDPDPRCQTRVQSSLRLLVGEAGQPAQVEAIRARPICVVETSQISGHCGGGRHWQWLHADPHPGLKSPGAGFRHDAGLVTVGNHPIHNGGIAAVQVDQNVSGVTIRNKRPEVDIVSISISGTEEPEGNLVTQLRSRPQPCTGERLPRGMVDQSNQITLAGHSGELVTDSGQRKPKSAAHKVRLALNDAKGDDFSANGSCANSAVSHPRGTPQSGKLHN
jgi:hypothetical protein